MYSYLHEIQKKSKVTREIAVIGSFDGCDTAAVGADARFVSLLIYRVGGTQGNQEREPKLVATFRSVCRPTCGTRSGPATDRRGVLTHHCSAGTYPSP